MEECTLIVLDEGIEPQEVAENMACCPQGPRPTDVEE